MKQQPETLFAKAVSRKNEGRPPVWLMRQAGRYHGHYQVLRKKYSFTELCKLPDVACEATLGPIRDFDFDAAILFSDLLFPLEVMGMGLRYEEGPTLDWHLREVADLNRLTGGQARASELSFQYEAISKIRAVLPAEKALIGFVGGPLTLFCYAVEGRHQGDLSSAREGLVDGRFAGFFEKLSDLLVENMVQQAAAGADTIAVLDTCAGEFSSELYAEFVVPMLRNVMERFRERSSASLLYYSKGTGSAHWQYLKGLPFSVLGVDWKNDLKEVLSVWGNEWAIQGNVDPSWLLLESADELEKRLRTFFSGIKELPEAMRRGWVCGLGHGVLPKTPESHVRLFLKLQKEYFGQGVCS